MSIKSHKVNKKKYKNKTVKKGGAALPVIAATTIISLIKSFITKKEEFDYDLGKPISEQSTNSQPEITPCVKITLPTDYNNEFSAGEMAKRTASFVSQRSGLSLADGVDRLIFKNQDYLEFFDKTNLFDKGYYGSVEEYKNLLKSSASSTYLNSKNNSPEIYVGTRVNIKLPNSGYISDSNMVARVVEKIMINGETYYIVEYKKRLDQGKSFIEKSKNLLSSSAKSLSGMTELAQLEIYNNEKAIQQQAIEPTLNTPDIVLNDESVTSPETPLKPNPYYSRYSCPIPANLVTKETSSAVPFFYKLNDEIYIPFENPDLFNVFHMLKYQFKKCLNNARINLLYHILSSFGKAMRQNEIYYNTLKGLSYPDNDEIKKNLIAADETLKNNKNFVEEMKNKIEKKISEEQKEEDQEKNNTPPNTQGGKKRTKKYKHSRNNKTKKIKGGLNLSGTVSGDIGVITDKISKYIFGKNLRTPEWRGKLPDDHPLKYVEEEQKMFLGLAILYYDNMNNEEEKKKYDEIFMDPNPFIDYLDESKNKDLTQNINNTLNEKYTDSTPYEMVLILADKIWPEREHTPKAPPQTGGIFGIRDMGIAKSMNDSKKYVGEKIQQGRQYANTKIQNIGEKIAKNNMILNKIFDYAYKRMVYYKLKKLFIEIDPNTDSLSDVQKNNLYNTVSFYRKIKFSTMMSAHFTCSTATNMAAAYISNPFAGAMGLASTVAQVPPLLHMASSLNTPQCYVAMYLCGYVLFFM
jgi:hypothetical protein